MSLTTSVFTTLLITAVITWYINRPVSIGVMLLMTFLFPTSMAVIGAAVLGVYLWRLVETQPKRKETHHE